MIALAVVGGRFLPVTDYQVSVQQDPTTVPTLTKRSVTTHAKTTVEAEITTPRNPLVRNYTTYIRLYNETTEFRFTNATILQNRSENGYVIEVEAGAVEEIKR